MQKDRQRNHYLVCLCKFRSLHDRVWQGSWLKQQESHVCHLLPKGWAGEHTGCFSVTRKAHREIEVHFASIYDFLVHRVFNPVSRYCLFHVLLASGSLVPTNLSTSRQAATPPSSSATRSERSCPLCTPAWAPSREHPRAQRRSQCCYRVQRAVMHGLGGNGTWAGPEHRIRNRQCHLLSAERREEGSTVTQRDRCVASPLTSPPASCHVIFLTDHVFSSMCWFIFLTCLSFMTDVVLVEKAARTAVLLQLKGPRPYF